MSSNISVTPGTGATVSTDEVTTLNAATVAAQQVQRIKLTFGAAGTGTDIQSSSPLPVTSVVTSLPALAAGSNIIGSVTQSGTWNVTNISGTISLPTGAATSANQTALNALFPTSLGTKTAANSLAVTLASDGPLTVVSGTTSDAAVANGAGGTIAGYLRSIKDAATDTTSASPVRLPGKYATVAASATAQALGTGAIGDYLSHVTIIPASTSPGAVTITDGTGSAITIFAGGASSVSNLVPFGVPLGLLSTSGGWKITTGASVSVIAEGKF